MSVQLPGLLIGSALISIFFQMYQLTGLFSVLLLLYLGAEAWLKAWSRKESLALAKVRTWPVQIRSGNSWIQTYAGNLKQGDEILIQKDQLIPLDLRVGGKRYQAGDFWEGEESVGEILGISEIVPSRAYPKWENGIWPWLYSFLAGFGFFALIYLKGWGEPAFLFLGLSMILHPLWLSEIGNCILSIRMALWNKCGFWISDAEDLEDVSDSASVIFPFSGGVTNGVPTIRKIILPSGKKMLLSGGGYSPEGKITLDNGEPCIDTETGEASYLMEAAISGTKARIWEEAGRWRFEGNNRLEVAGLFALQKIGLASSGKTTSLLLTDGTATSICRLVHDEEQTRWVFVGTPTEVLARCNKVRGSVSSAFDIHSFFDLCQSEVSPEHRLYAVAEKKEPDPNWEIPPSTDSVRGLTLVGFFVVEERLVDEANTILARMQENEIELGLLLPREPIWEDVLAKFWHSEIGRNPSGSPGFASHKDLLFYGKTAQEKKCFTKPLLWLERDRMVIQDSDRRDKKLPADRPDVYSFWFVFSAARQFFRGFCSLLQYSTMNSVLFLIAAVSYLLVSNAPLVLWPLCVVWIGRSLIHAVWTLGISLSDSVGPRIINSALLEKIPGTVVYLSSILCILGSAFGAAALLNLGLSSVSLITGFAFIFCEAVFSLGFLETRSAFPRGLKAPILG